MAEYFYDIFSTISGDIRAVPLIIANQGGPTIRLYRCFIYAGPNEAFEGDGGFGPVTVQRYSDLSPLVQTSGAPITSNNVVFTSRKVNAPPISDAIIVRSGPVADLVNSPVVETFRVVVLDSGGRSNTGSPGYNLREMQAPSMSAVINFVGESSVQPITIRGNQCLVVRARVEAGSGNLYNISTIVEISQEI